MNELMMKQESRNKPEVKEGMHPRNPHRYRYNFAMLTLVMPELAPFVTVNEYQIETIDYSNPQAVKLLNKAILMHHYQLRYWDIPDNYLCPPIPGRADYIHYIADLLATCNREMIPAGSKIKIFDIGTGANLIYPIIGIKEYGWSFIASEVDFVALKSAQTIVDANPMLTGNVECRQQHNSRAIFQGVLQEGEKIDVAICNPPFHTSAEEAAKQSQRKMRNLNYKKSDKPVLNFGGQSHELWCEGGEEAFVRRMIFESTQISMQCFWFTSLISKRDNLKNVYRELRKVGVRAVRTLEMAQGQKTSRIVCWTFLSLKQQQDWRRERWLSESK